MWTVKFWKDATERAIKTAAQTAVGVLGAVSVDHATNWGVIPWETGAIAVVIATATSLLTSIASTGTGDPQSAALQADRWIQGGKRGRHSE